MTMSSAISSAVLCASKLDYSFATSLFPEAIHWADLVNFPPSCFFSVFSISCTTPVQFVTIPAICFCRVCGIDWLLESLKSSASNSRTVFRESSSLETASRSLLADRTSFTKPITARDVRVMDDIKPKQVAVIDKGSISRLLNVRQGYLPPSESGDRGSHCRSIGWSFKTPLSLTCIRGGSQPILTQQDQVW